MSVGLTAQRSTCSSQGMWPLETPLSSLSASAKGLLKYGIQTQPENMGFPLSQTSGVSRATHPHATQKPAHPHLVILALRFLCPAVLLTDTNRGITDRLILFRLRSLISPTHSFLFYMIINLVCDKEHALPQHTCEGQRTTLRRLLSCTMWTPGTEFRSSGLAACAFTC